MCNPKFLDICLVKLQTQIRLLLEEQFDQGFHCLSLDLHHLDFLIVGHRLCLNWLIIAKFSGIIKNLGALWYFVTKLCLLTLHRCSCLTGLLVAILPLMSRGIFYRKYLFC